MTRGVLDQIEQYLTAKAHGGAALKKYFGDGSDGAWSGSGKNLLTRKQSSPVDGVIGWGEANRFMAGVTRLDSPSFTGDGCLRLQYPTTGWRVDFQDWTVFPGGLTAIAPIGPSTQYTFSAYARTNLSSAPVIATVRAKYAWGWLNFHTSNLNTGTVTVNNTSWSRVEVTFTTPASVSGFGVPRFVQIDLRKNGTVNLDDEFYFDGFQLELGASATTWEPGAAIGEFPDEMFYDFLQPLPTVVKQYESLTIPEGDILRPFLPCAGLVVYVRGNCTINGTLSMSERGALSFGGLVPPAMFTNDADERKAAVYRLAAPLLRGGAGGAGGNGGGTYRGWGGVGGMPTPWGGGPGGGGGGGGITNVAWGIPGGGCHLPGVVWPWPNPVEPGTAYGYDSAANPGIFPPNMYGRFPQSHGLSSPSNRFQARVTGASRTGWPGFAGSGGFSIYDSSSYSSGRRGGAGPGGGGGGAGDSSSSGGNGLAGGWPGGHLLLIVGGDLTIGATGAIRADGGNGGAGGNGATNGGRGGGGGGAGGGSVLIVCRGGLTNGGAITANGGSGGPRGASGLSTNSTDGSSGSAGDILIL